MAARGIRVRTSNCINHVSLNIVLRVAVILLMTLGFLFYISIFISPVHLLKVLQVVVPCSNDNDHPHKPSTSSNLLLSTPKLSNAMDLSPGHHNDRNDTKAEHSGLENMELKDSISERNDSMETAAASTICKGDAAGSGQKQVEDHQILKESTPDLKSFEVLVGVMITASKADRRSLLRLAYGVQSSPDAHISVRFIIGELEGGGEMERTLVGMENATYGDIIVLNCSENLNEGKTFAFFSSLPDRGVEYDYVMKTDDDSYIRFENLGRSLKPLSRTDLYYGYILPCENDDPYTWYMAGMGYLISWDLVLWIRESSIARNRSVGTEDQLVGEWFNEGGVARHRVNEKPQFYDHQDFGGKCAHELVPETILVHQVKTQERWAHVLGFFERDRISRALSIS